MRHRVKKIKFKKGKDANKLMIKKLLVNFIRKGKIKTTIKKGKILKSLVDKVVNLAKKNKAYLISKYINNKKIVEFFVNKIVPIFSDRETGFTSIKKLGKRLSDGSEMVVLTWIKPVIVISNKNKNEKKQAQTNNTNKSTKKD